MTAPLIRFLLAQVGLGAGVGLICLSLALLCAPQTALQLIDRPGLAMAALVAGLGPFAVGFAGTAMACLDQDRGSGL